MIEIEQNTSEIVERSPSIALRVAGPDKGYATLFVSGNVSAYGYSKDDFLSWKLNWMDIVYPDDRESVAEVLRQYDKDRTDQFSILYRIIRADNSFLWVTDTSRAKRDLDGKILYYDTVIRDYTETKSNIKKIEDDLRQNTALNDILQKMYDADPDKALQAILDGAGAYLDVSRVTLFECNSGHTRSTIMHEWCNTGISPIKEDVFLSYENDLPGVASTLMESGLLLVNNGENPGGMKKRFETEEIKALAMFAVCVQDVPFGFICFDECVKKRQWDSGTVTFLRNIAKLVSATLLRKRNDMVVGNMVLTDRLTGLHNRYDLERHLNKAISEAKENGQASYILFIDIDDFKIINDSCGHDYGDAILRSFASFLLDSFGRESEVFRFGGAEFVILLHPEYAESVHRVIEKLLGRVQLPWNVMDKSFYCSLSIGVVAFPEDYQDSKDIIKHADIAMYQAKRSGKNSYAFYNSAQDNDFVRHAELEKEMLESIDNNFSGFSVFYQPQTDSSGVVVGAEALLRWTLPDGSSVPPVQFIPLAEYLGLIVQVGEFVLRESTQVCRHVNETNPSFWVSINISVRQFQQQDFLERVMTIMKETGVNPANIIFEITENMVIYDMGRMKALSEEFREHGIQISMSDFGAGDSSLGNMRELPIDIVKIDRTVIQGISTNAYSKSFIRLMVDLVHSMGKKVCIEGVETAEQLRYCQECHADYVQGFHLQMPMPLADFEKIVQLKQTLP
ncbi:MAG: EAL domain-containing protein [Burkholderiaceae bacterium]|jgi:diguanylate cyclase (GGDEF)-like protein/PAS domain S-box-containing protein|nr:EAL domain-containing protein [Burkholderiaceae bacterium]